MYGVVCCYGVDWAQDDMLELGTRYACAGEDRSHGAHRDAVDFSLWCDGVPGLLKNTRYTQRLEEIGMGACGLCFSVLSCVASRAPSPGCEHVVRSMTMPYVVGHLHPRPRCVRFAYDQCLLV